jgi:hypothetical protein
MHYDRWYRHGDPTFRKFRLRTPGEAGDPIENKEHYLICHFPEHPNATKGGKIMQHIVIMTEHLGRPLFGDETVHHKNGVRNDNRWENLELWSSSHPSGQRVSDKVAWAHKILERYEN